MGNILSFFDNKKNKPQHNISVPVIITDMPKNSDPKHFSNLTRKCNKTKIIKNDLKQYPKSYLTEFSNLRPYAFYN